MFNNSVIACDDATATLTSVSDNGDGTYNCTFDVCVEYFGLEGSVYGFGFEFNNPNGTTAINSFSPASITSGTGDVYVGALYDGAGDAPGGGIYEVNDATVSVLEYNTSELFPSHSSGTLCFSVSMTITGYPTSVDVHVNNNGFAGCFVVLPFPALPLDCEIQNISAGAQTACSTIDNTYTQIVNITFANAPGSGTLDVGGQSFLIGSSPQSITLVGLPSDGNPVDITAVFSANGACTLTETNLFTAPANCTCDAEAGAINN